MAITRRHSLCLVAVSALVLAEDRAARIAAEFAAGDVVVVDGWLLARSEVKTAQADG